jgi:aspartyl/asparaginyl-tRNA synthetase
MFEFESHGTMHDLKIMENELLEFLGFGIPYVIKYEDACNELETDIITGDHEIELQNRYGKNISLQYFPERTNPFWNMQRDDAGLAQKIDILLFGQETIGSAERSSDVKKMKEKFLTIEDGKYSQKLYDLFSPNRVINELNEFLENDFINRYGGGIGVTRLIRAMELNGSF